MLHKKAVRISWGRKRLDGMRNMSGGPVLLWSQVFPTTDMLKLDGPYNTVTR